MPRNFPLGKFLDFLSDNVDTAFIGGVEFGHSLLEKVMPEEVLGEGKDGRSFSGTRGSIKHKVRDLTGEDTLTQG